MVLMEMVMGGLDLDAGMNGTDSGNESFQNALLILSTITPRPKVATRGAGSRSQA